MIKDFLTTKQAAKILGVNDSRVRQFLLAKRLKGTKIGTSWLINRRTLQRFKNGRDRDLRAKK